jgi:cation diffusion facilitator family transporter
MDEKNILFRKGEKAAKLSGFILFALGVLKGIVALLSGSVALLASTIDSFSDIFSSIAVWGGLKLAQKKPTERFPYGYYKAETFALLIVSATIVISSVLILKESFDNFFQTVALSFSGVALAVAALSATIYYVLARYKKKVGHEISSQALTSEGVHSMVDVYTSLLVFIGIFLASYGYQVVQALVGFFISIYVLKNGLWSGKDAVLVLMDVSPSPQRTKEIKEIAEGVRGVKGTHNVRLRKSGPVFFVEMHVELQEDLPLDKAHMISEEIETRIKQQFRDVESISIHVGLAHKEKVTIAIPVLKDKGLESITSLHFGNMPFFAFIEMEEGQIGNVYVKVNKAAGQARKRGIDAARFLVNEKVDVVLAGGIGEGPFHLLKDNLIQIYVLPERVQIKEAIRLLNENKLERMAAPTEKA